MIYIEIRPLFVVENRSASNVTLKRKMTTDKLILSVLEHQCS